MVVTCACDRNLCEEGVLVAEAETVGVGAETERLRETQAEKVGVEGVGV